MGLLTVLGALLLAVTAQPKVKLEGSDVTLVPRYTGDPSEINWKINGNKLVDMELKPRDILFYRLQDRATISHTDGSLTIRNLTIGDSGMYKAEAVMVNNVIQETEINLIVRAQQHIKLERSNITLVPNYTGDLKEIIWSINERIVVEIKLNPWNELTFNLPRDKVTINETNGALTIRNLTINDSGFYMAQAVLNNTEAVDKTDITLTIRVPLAINKTVGDDVILVPDYTRNLSEIKWTMNGNKLVEMKPWEKIIFHFLQDRATINHTDGRLTIRDLTTGDSGFYKAEVIMNNVIQETGIKVIVFQPSCLSGGIIALIVFLAVVAVIAIIIIILVLRLYCKNPNCPSRGIIALIVILVLAVITIIIAIIIELCLCCKKSSCLSGGITLIVILAVVAVIFIIVIILVLWWYCMNQKSLKGDIEINKIPELVGCITVKFLTDGFSHVDESSELLKDHLKSLCLNICGVKEADHGDCTTEALLSNGKKCTFTKETGGAVIIESVDDIITLTVPDTEKVTKFVWKKGGVSHFEWAVSSLKLHTNNITLEPGSVTVNNAEGKGSYAVDFQLEERLERKPIISVTFHPINLTGKTQITWKKDGQPVNIGANRIQSGPNGDLTINKVTSEDKGKYTVQCEDKKLDQEFFLCF